MPFTWFVALRYLRDGKSQTALILSAVAVGVSVIIFLSALMNGLQVSLVAQTLGAQPHVTLRPQEEVPRALSEATDTLAISHTIQKAAQRLKSIDQWPNVVSLVERMPGVVAVSPTVTGAGFVTRGDAKRAIVVRGIDAERFLGVIDVRAHIVAGRFDVTGESVVVGKDLAEDLGLNVGDKLHLETSRGKQCFSRLR